MNWTPLGGVGAIVALDQLTKLAALAYLKPGDSLSILSEYVQLTLTWNSGGAFGILAGQGVILTALTVAVAAAVLVVLGRGGLQTGVIAGLVAVAGGAIGNLIDRLRFSYVVDFIDVGISPSLRWPTFNVADAAIVLGTALLLWRLLTPSEGSRH